MFKRQNGDWEGFIELAKRSIALIASHGLSTRDDSQILLLAGQTLPVNMNSNWESLYRSFQVLA